jgi:hypothetical protein
MRCPVQGTPVTFKSAIDDPNQIMKSKAAAASTMPMEQDGDEVHSRF